MLFLKWVSSATQPEEGAWELDHVIQKDEGGISFNDNLISPNAVSGDFYFESFSKGMGHHLLQSRELDILCMVLDP